MTPDPFGFFNILVETSSSQPGKVVALFAFNLPLNNSIATTQFGRLILSGRFNKRYCISFRSRSSWSISLLLAKIAVLIFALFFSLCKNQTFMCHVRLNRNLKNIYFDSKIFFRIYPIRRLLTSIPLNSQFSRRTV